MMPEHVTLPRGLVWYPDNRPGITRRRHGAGFTYRDADGTTIARGPERDRILALAVPPAYENVWISPRVNGHLQATGYDARTRKQYRYHPKWGEARSAEKYDHLPRFGRALPAIRRRVTRDLALEPGDERFALAAAVLLIDRLSLRVGNEAYARENGSYGALTLQRRHLKLTEKGLNLSYTAKGGKKVRDLPGAELLVWTEEDGSVRRLSSGSLNDYLAETAGEAFTAKTFRTWAGTLAAFEAAESGSTTIKALSEAAADRLANTPTVARNSYIHPAVIALAGEEAPIIKAETVTGLRAAENRLLALIER